jgi:hypothetical protein
MSQLDPFRKPKKDDSYLNDGLRAAFKESLTKLLQINTRDQVAHPKFRHLRNSKT